MSGIFKWYPVLEIHIRKVSQDFHELPSKICPVVILEHII